MQFFLIFGAKKIAALQQEGKIKYREQLIDGLDQAPQALIGLLKGENFGKVVIRVAADD